MDTCLSLIRHPVTDVVVEGVAPVRGVVVTRVHVGSAARKITVSDRRSFRGNGPLDRVGELIRNYLDGKTVDFSSVVIADDFLTPFQKTVLRIVRRIPRSARWSYTRVAVEAGFPAAVRATASVMRINPYPIIIPCHRVIRKNGDIGAYCGERAGPDANLKIRLLRLEDTLP